MKLNDIQRIFDAAYSEVTSDQSSLLGLGANLAKQKQIEQSWPKYWQKKGSTQCMPHALCFIFYTKNMALCGKCWSVVDGVEVDLAKACVNERRLKHTKRRWERGR